MCDSGIGSGAATASAFTSCELSLGVPVILYGVGGVSQSSCFMLTTRCRWSHGSHELAPGFVFITLVLCANIGWRVVDARLIGIGTIDVGADIFLLF